MQAHPAVEPLEMTAPTSGVLEVSANTSSGGPGYHRRMVDDVRVIGDRLGVTWQESNGDDRLDETGYFESGDRDRVDAEMLAWLRAVLGHAHNEAEGLAMIAMPIGYRASVMDQDVVVTFMGPRDRAWVARGAAHPADAVDMFAWWGDERDASHYRNRAIARMWVDVRWSTPVDEESRNHLIGADRDLRRALELDPTIELPWREWEEIRRLIEGPGGEASSLDRVIAKRAAAVPAGMRLIGYRRGSVPVPIDPGWSITMPGSFHEVSEGDAWVGYDQDRTIRLSSVTVVGKDGRVPSAEELAADAPSGPDAIGPGDDSLRGSATIGEVEEDGRRIRALQGVVTSDGELLIVTIVFGDDEAWAIRTYRSIRFHPERAMHGGVLP